MLEKRFGLDPACEITIECNPGTVDSEKIAEYRNAGINRISIGLQSASDRLLSLAGRSHRAVDFDRTVRLFRRYGFTNISADIMLGLPGQQPEDLMDTISYATSYDLEHLSMYSLSIEEGTRFFTLYAKNDELLPDAQTERSMYHDAIDLLQRRGYHPYEISNFAKPGAESLHNLSCWKGEEYLGFGAGAHSYFRSARTSNVPDPVTYIQRVLQNDPMIPGSDSPATCEAIRLNEKDRMNEFFLLGFRLTEGIDLDDFERRFGPESDSYLPILQKCADQRLIEKVGRRYRLTSHGLDYANRVFLEFV
jgi:oxygen-independent coproporphyrinogen III oxidase